MTLTSPPASSAAPPTATVPVYHLSTVDAYDAWAAVYDSDGNMLQAVDDGELLTLLPDVLARAHADPHRSGLRLRLLDFGCGTGRNTAKLLAAPTPPTAAVDVVGVDASGGMLDKARQKLAGVTAANAVLQLVQHDFSSAPRPTELAAPFDAAISTLVLEHLPLDEFFATMATLVRDGGWVLVTNMHPEMGRVSQAGFVADASALPASAADGTPAGKIKIRGTSYAHEVDETAAAAVRVGFAVEEVREKEMTEDMIATVGPRGRKWIGSKVWYGMVLRKLHVDK